MHELLGNMLRGEPVDPRTLQPTMPASAGAAVLKALRPSPKDRFATAQEFGAALLQPGSGRDSAAQAQAQGSGEPLTATRSLLEP